MCYPCKNCGKCKQVVLEVTVTCPVCAAQFPPSDAVCPQCGWSLAAPGTSSGASLKTKVKA